MGNIVNDIKNYISSGEKKGSEFALGFELEHFIVDCNDETLTYHDEYGAEYLLERLLERGYDALYADGFLMGAKNSDVVYSLEPGSQFEISINKRRDLKEFEEIYLKERKILDEILEEKGLRLINKGYQIKTCIDDIKILPKKRYDYMFDYFKDKGRYAHNMMKGTAAFQVSIDYSDEEDFRKKMRVFNALSPLFYALFENAEIFEGKAERKHGIRLRIWDKLDDDRAGLIKEAFSDDFSYEDYANIIASRSPILIERDGEFIYSKKEILSELYDSMSEEETAHVLSMFFFDVRVKKYIEIRMMDSMEIKRDMEAMALIKAIAYKKLDEVYNLIKDISYEDALRAKKEIVDLGIDARLKNKSIRQFALELTDMLKYSLNKEASYLASLQERLMKI